ncbi:MAG: type IV secretion system DNA-binding domain-containing protein [Gemmatimonadaceae bacterium]|nr:type IV secretion system DNA-binding domain-containing protein [Gemmatimonadaceae bacterium]
MTPHLPWGGISFPRQLLSHHYLVIGQNQSGKTLLIRMLSASALCPDRGSLKERALVFDAKLEWYGVLRGLGVPESQILVLNPFDARATAWDIARDTTDSGAVRQIAHILIPVEPNSTQPYFANAARELVAVVIEIFRTFAPDQWTLNDVIEAFSDEHDLKSVLALTPEGRNALARYVLGNEKSSADVLSTLDTKLKPFAVAARLAARCTQRVSFREWSKSDFSRILLLGRDDTVASAMDPLNRAMVKCAVQYVLGRVEEDPADQTWFFLDECRWAGELDGLQGLLLKGRSKGAYAVLGLQDVQGMRHVYGQYQADEILAQCGNVAVLRLMCPDTMRWAAQLFGRYEEYLEGFGESETSGVQSSRTSSHDWKLSERPSILEQQFRSFPLPEPRIGIWGAFLCPGYAWMDCVPPQFIEVYLRAKSADAGFIPRPVCDQDRLPWTAAFRSRLQRKLQTLDTDEE